MEGGRGGEADGPRGPPRRGRWPKTTTCDVPQPEEEPPPLADVRLPSSGDGAPSPPSRRAPPRPRGVCGTGKSDREGIDFCAAEIWLHERHSAENAASVAEFGYLKDHRIVPRLPPPPPRVPLQPGAASASLAQTSTDSPRPRPSAAPPPAPSAIERLVAASVKNKRHAKHPLRQLGKRSDTFQCRGNNLRAMNKIPVPEVIIIHIPRSKESIDLQYHSKNDSSG
uniref:Uncharacterized protein n=1 Tax=Leersia perrieri TaxID=77586 RepID=A0A0D9XTF8_9ORYZ